MLLFDPQSIFRFCQLYQQCALQLIFWDLRLRDAFHFRLLLSTVIPQCFFVILDFYVFEMYKTVIL